MPPAASISSTPTAAPRVPAEAVRAFAERWHLREVALFGSVLRADFRPDSDVDVMVTFDPSERPTLSDMGAMRDELAALFGRPVDLLSRGAVESMVNWYRRRAILESARVVYAR